MTKTLILVLAFGAVAFAAPAFKQSKDELSDPALHLEKRAIPALDATEAQLDDENAAVDNNNEKRDIAVPASETVQHLDEENVEANKNFDKRQVFISFPYAKYRYEKNPYRYGFNPQQQDYEPIKSAGAGLYYPYEKILNHMIDCIKFIKAIKED